MTRLLVHEPATLCSGKMLVAPLPVDDAFRGQAFPSGPPPARRHPLLENSLHLPNGEDPHQCLIFGSSCVA